MGGCYKQMDHIMPDFESFQSEMDVSYKGKFHGQNK